MLRRIGIKSLLFLFCLSLSSVAYSQDKFDPAQIAWPTCTSLQYYSPFDNTCHTLSAGIPYPPAGLAHSTGSAWDTATFSHVVALFAGGSCTGYLKNDGTCSTSGGMVFPSAGIAKSTGSAWTAPSFSDIVALWASGACTSGYLKFDGTCSTPAGGSSTTTTRVLVAGLVNDGNVGANTGTDNTSAWTSCQSALTAGQVCYFPPGTYRILTAGPKITTSNTGIQCAPNHATTIFTSSSSAVITGIQGTNTSTTINYASIGGPDSGCIFRRSVPSAANAIGVSVQYAVSPSVLNNWVLDTGVGFDTTYSPTGGYNSYSNNLVEACGVGVAAGAGPNIGFALHGGTTGFVTQTVSNNNFQNNCGSSPSSYFAKTDGQIQDLNLIGNFAGSATTPIYLAGNTGQDVHVTNQTWDHCFTDCIYLNITDAKNITISGGQNWLTVADAGQTAGIEIDNTPNVSISDFQCHSSKNAPCFYVHGSGATGEAIVNNRCSLGNVVSGSGLGQCFSAAAGAQGILVANITSGNSKSGYTLSPYQFAGSSAWAISGNTAEAGAGSPMFSFDATSNNNCCWNGANTNNWGTVSDAGTGNQSTASVAWGGITGTLASQADLQAALNLLAPLASPAFTGVPTVPTAAPGTNTTQIASTAFVQAAVTGGTLPAQAANTVVMNASGSSAVPSAVAMPSCGSVSADLYNTTTHAWSCVSIGGVGGAFQYNALGNPPAAASFTWVNSGTTTSNNGGALLLDIPFNASANWRIFKKSSPATPWSVAAAFKSDQINTNSSVSGLYITDGTKIEGIEFLTQASGVWTFRVERITNITTDGSTVYTNTVTAAANNASTLSLPWTGGVFVRWRDNGTTLFSDYSMDGSNWTNFYSESVGTFITPNAYGVGGLNASSGLSDMFIDLTGWLETGSATL